MVAPAAARVKGAIVAPAAARVKAPFAGGPFETDGL